MSFMTLVINIVADLSPHGMLPLAYGIAQGGPTGLVPALATVAVFGTMSAYTMITFAQLAAETNSNSISDLWEKLFNPKTKWIADLAVLALCFGCNVFYSAFVGDIFGALSSAVGFTGPLAKRWVVLGAISLFALLPLCLLEDLSSLQFSSILGVFGIMFTVLFHVIRLSDGSYVPKIGSFAKELAAKMQPHWPTPKFNTWRVNSGSLVLVNMLCVAFLAHYNAINYYKELDGVTHKRYTKAISAGFGIAAAVFGTMMIVGYMIFGDTAQPLILNNFHRTSDLLATCARCATGLAIVFAYPLMFAGLKSSMYNLIDTAVKPKSKSDTKTLKTSGIITALAIISSIAFKCGEEDVSVVLGIVGSVLGCSVAYVLPSLLKLKYMRLRKAQGLVNKRSDVIINHALVALGVIFGALGVWVTIQSAGEHGGHH